jgi:hypothetical protein
MKKYLLLLLITVLSFSCDKKKQLPPNTYQINVMAEVTYCFESATNLFKEMNEIGKPLVLTDEVFDEDNRDTENDPFKGTSIEGKD